MDHANIGAAIRAVASGYFHGARRSGRTEALIDRLKSGDRVVCPDNRVANDLRRRCQMRGKHIDCIVVSPHSPERLIERDRSTGRTIFEHSWVEQFYLDVLDRARKDIDMLEQQASAPDTPPSDPRGEGWSFHRY